MLELDAVSKSFDEHLAIQAMSLEFASGQRTAIIGPSGCGKSTLLRLILRLLRPDSGEVRFAGTALDDQNIDAQRRSMGYVLQEGGLFPHLTVTENLSLAAMTFGWERSRILARIEELAELARHDLDLGERYPAQLSGGQRQRVSLMRALMLDPQLLLLDEPLGALDPMVRADLQRDLRDVCEQLGKTVLLVTHDLAEAAFLCPRILLIDEGKVVQDGSFDELRSRPAAPFVGRFVAAQRLLHAIPDESSRAGGA